MEVAFLILVGVVIAVCLIGTLAFLGSIVSAAEKSGIEHRKSRATDRKRKEEAHREAAAEAEMQKLLKFGLTCPRCEHLALPIPGTKNRCHSPDCRFQFAGDPHNL